MKNLELLELFKLGFIPKDDELEIDFIKRTKNFLNNSKEVSCDQLKALQITKKLFDINPYWVPITFSNKDLKFYEGAVFEVEDDQIKLTLKKTFLRSKKLFGLYEKPEVIAHELVHAARYTLNSTKYEEHFAYQTSNGLRRFLGPLFSSSYQAIILLSLVAFPLIVAILSPIYRYTSLLNLLPVSYLFSQLFRVGLEKRVLSKCRKNLKRVLAKKNDPDKILFMLKDDEIEKIAKLKTHLIKHYIESKKDNLRWQWVIAHFEMKVIE